MAQFFWHMNFKGFEICTIWTFMAGSEASIPENKCNYVNTVIRHEPLQKRRCKEAIGNGIWQALLCCFNVHFISSSFKYLRKVFIFHL